VTKLQNMATNKPRIKSAHRTLPLSVVNH